MSEIIGVAGAFLVVVAWVFEVQQIARTRHSPLDWNFGVLYLAGALLLTFYAWLINSPIFALLNSLAALMALFGLYFKWTERKKQRWRSKRK